ncbi:MAG: nucleotidyltransferase family protein, partial [Chitinophagaceae bacterium]|nr:nucleotidyltransferase family protein [Chitinophagaceae bacterium]
GGGLLKAAEFFAGTERFITLNADILTDLHIGKLIEFHERRQPLISFGVTNRSSSRVLLFDHSDRLCGWRNVNTGEEKMAMSAHVGANVVAAGGTALTPKAYSCVAIFEPSIFQLMPGYGFQGKFSLTDVYLRLAPDHLILGYDHSGDRFVDVGKPESVAIAEGLFL